MYTNHVSQHIGIPPYGQTTPTTDIHNVPVGGMWSVFAPGSLTSPHDLSIPTGSRYVLAIGPSSFGAGLVLLDAPVLGLHTGGYVYLNVIDMVADDFGGLLVSGAGRTDPDRAFRNPVGQTTRAMMLPYLPSQTGAMRIELNAGGGSTGVLVGALLDAAIPDTEGTYWMVLAGRLNAHLDGPDGLRFIPGLPSVTAPLRSAPLVRFSNALPNAVGVTICQSTTMIAHVASGALSPPQVPPSAAPWALEVHVGPDCATGSMQSVSVGTPIGRTLVSIAGNTTTTWAAVSIPEPVPAVGSVQTIVIHNALPTTSDIAGATAIDSLSTSSASFTSLPTVLMATTTVGTKSFAWDLMSRQTWLVVRALAGGAYAAYEIDSPYAANWSIVSVNGS
jgi:hypothetical protein